MTFLYDKIRTTEARQIKYNVFEPITTYWRSLIYERKNLYNRTALDNGIVELLIRTSILTKKLNSLTLYEMEQKNEIMTELFASIGKNFFIGDNFHCDFGKNILVGDNFHADYNVYNAGRSEIRIGDNCLIGPDVGIYTAGHRLSPTDRTKDGYGSSAE
jgi:maltose O-acetyltransferase